jgi:hypothetical protein
MQPATKVNDGVLVTVRTGSTSVSIERREQQGGALLHRSVIEKMVSLHFSTKSSQNRKNEAILRQASLGKEAEMVRPGGEAGLR